MKNIINKSVDCSKKAGRYSRCIIKKVLLAICIFMIFAITVFEGNTDKTASNKHIHIVFDNSISMAKDRNTDLADATYALQVLLGMLNEGDEAVIYSVSEYQDEWRSMNADEKKAIRENLTFSSQNSCEDRVPISVNTISGNLTSQISNNVVGEMADYTYFYTVMNALEELHNDKSQGEKWLVVLTDGKYEDWGDESSSSDWNAVASNVNKYLSNDKYKEINIIHYSFGLEEYSGIEEKGENVTYYLNNEDDNANQMLNNMITIANQIFGRQEIKPTKTEEGYEFKLEVPASKVIIFAQSTKGEQGNKGMEISWDNKKATTAIDVQTISEMPEVDERVEGGYNSGENYVGQILTYDFGTENEAAWVLEGNIFTENVTTMRIYYEPVIASGLLLENVETDKREYTIASSDEIRIPSGEYKISTQLYDPSKLKYEDLDEEQITEALISRDVFTISPLIYVGDMEPQTEWSGILLPGEYTIRAEMDIYAGFTEYVEVKVQVYDALSEVEANLVVPESGINMQELNAEGNCIELIVSNRGEVLSEELKTAAKITHVNAGESCYRYRVEETETGWQLWPEKNGIGDRSQFSGTMEETFSITFDIEGIEVAPIECTAEVFYHGNPFVIEIETNWGDSIGILDWFRTLKMEARIDGKRIDWNQVEIKDVSPLFWEKEDSVYDISLSEDKQYWKLEPKISKINLFELLEYENDAQEISLHMTLERYGQEETYSQIVKIKMDIAIREIIIVVIIGLVVLYIMLVTLFKLFSGINLLGLDGYIEYSKEPLNNLPIKIKKCTIYNMFALGSSKFKVYLNEIVNGDKQKIVFKCKARGICMIQNFSKCQSFSQISINGFETTKNSMYDLEEKLRIVLEKDPEKTIVVYRK